jgi:signal transduction histidine kinase
MKTQRLLNSLTFRATLLYMALFTGSVSLMLGLGWVGGVWWPLQIVQRSVAEEARGLETVYKTRGRDALLARLEARARAPAPRRAYHVLLAADGAVIAANLPVWPVSAHQDWVRFEFGTYDGADEEEHEVFARNLMLPDGRSLIVGRDTEDLDEREDLIQEGLAWGSGFAVLLGGLGGLLMSLAVSRRLEGINRAAHRVIAGDMGGRIPLRGSGDDFDQLAETLNLMLARIQELVETVSRMSDGIAHELRTPLSRMRAELEDLVQLFVDEEPARDRADAALVEVARLQTIFDAMIRIVRIETGRSTLRAETIALAPLLRDAVELHVPEADDRAQTLVLTVPSDLTIRADRDLVFQAVYNLLDNAVKYAPRGGRIAVDGEQQGSSVTITVTDNGPGVSEKHRDRVTERFYRVPEAGGAPGIGLGLALVSAIVARHGGRLVLDDAAPGLRVRIVLPA